MKRIFKYTLALACAAMVLSSCSRDEDMIFDKSAAERLDQAKADYTKMMSDKGGKWVMEYFSNGKEHGYTFVCDFKADGTVTMTTNHEWTNPASTTLSETSLWNIRTDNGVVLSFSTYNSLFHIFCDPDNYNDPSEGETQTNKTGRGHEGDYEFVFIDVQEEGGTIKLKGKKRGYYIYMHRLPEDTNNEEYIAQCVEANNSMFSSKIKRFYLNDMIHNERFIITQNNGIFSAYPEKGDAIVQSSSINGLLNAQGIRFIKPFGLSPAATPSDSVYFESFRLQPDGTLLCHDQNDRVSYISAGPLADLFVTPGYTWTINQKTTTGQPLELINAVTSEFASAASATVQNYRFTYSSEDKAFALTVTLRVRRGGQNLTTTVKYLFDAVPNGDKVKMTYTGPADTSADNYGKAIVALGQLFDYISAQEFTLSAENLMNPTTMELTASEGNAFVISL